MQSWSERRTQLAKAHPFHRLVVPALTLLYLATLEVLGGLGWEHFVLAGSFLFFSVWSDSSRSLAKVVQPYLFYGIVYDSMRWYEGCPKIWRARSSRGRRACGRWTSATARP